MTNTTESGLRDDLSETRKLEMDRYGRTDTYDQIAIFLQGDRQTAFSLVNHALAIVDDEIDANGNGEHLNKAKVLLNQGFREQEAKFVEPWERNIYKLGQTLSRLHRDGFLYAPNVVSEINNYWEIEKQNLSRKGRILSSVELHELNLGIGRSVGLQFLYLLCPDLDQECRESIATSYGIAIKLADNLSDLNEDLEQGYINISGDNIGKHHLNIAQKYEGDLQSYKAEEFVRIKQYYDEEDRIVDEIIKKYPSQEKGILFFKNIAHSWLQQITDEMRGNNE
ncbi:MAG: hypothetical protein AAB358_00480 [Patescibacteria group bacterium]